MTITRRQLLQTGVAGLCTVPFFKAEAKSKVFYATEPVNPKREIKSIKIETTFELEQVFEGGRLEVFEDIEEPVITISIDYDDGCSQVYEGVNKSWQDRKLNICHAKNVTSYIVPPEPVPSSQGMMVLWQISRVDIIDNGTFDIVMEICQESGESYTAICSKMKLIAEKYPATTGAVPTVIYNASKIGVEQ
jgi:hypothetical protein